MNPKKLYCVIRIAARSWILYGLKKIKFFPARFLQKSQARYQEAIDKLYSQSLYSPKTKVYKAIIQKWIERESERFKDETKKKKQQVALFRLAMCVSLLIYQESKTNNKLSIPRAKVYDYAQQNRIELPEIDINSKSLLFRDADGEFIFAHKSILEFFLAINGCEKSWLVAELFDKSGWENFNYFLKEITIVDKLYPFLKKSHKGKIEFKFGANEPYLKYPAISVEQVAQMVSLKITGNIGYVDPTFFYALKNVSIDSYYNVATYLVYEQHYCSLEVQHLLEFLLRNDDDQFNMLQKVIDIYEYYRLYDQAADWLEKYIELKNIFLQEKEYQRLIDFYKNDGNKEKFLPLRKKSFIQLTAKYFREYFYLNDLFTSGYYTELIEEFETFKSGSDIDAACYRMVAESHLKLDNLDGAVQCYNEALAKDLDISEIVEKITGYYFGKKEFEKATDFINTCIASAKDDEQYNSLILVLAQFQFDSYGSVTTDLIKNPAGKDDKTKKIFYEDLVQLYKDTDQYDSGIYLALELLKMDPDNFILRNQLGICYLRKKDTTRAINSFLDAIRIMEKNSKKKYDLNPKNYLHPIIYNNLATTFEDEKRYEDAIAYYEKAIDSAGPKRKEYDDYLERMAGCFEKLEKWESAFYAYRKLFARSYDTSSLKKVIETSLKTGNAQHIYRVYYLMGEIRGKEKHFLNEEYQSIIDYFVSSNLLYRHEEEILVVDAAFENYYNVISGEYLKI